MINFWVNVYDVGAMPIARARVSAPRASAWFVAIAEPPRGAPALAARTVAAAMSWAEAFSDPPGAGRNSSASIVDCAMSLPLVQFAHRGRSDAASLPTAVLDCHERRPLLRHQLRRAAASLKETGSWHFSGLIAVHAAVEARPGSGARPRPTGGGSPLMSGPCPLAPVIHRAVSWISWAAG